MQFNEYFKSVPILNTKSLLLRPFERSDMPDYFDIIYDERVGKYMGGGINLFREEPHITNWLNNINGRLLRSKTVFTWCIELKSEKKIIGRIDLGGFEKKTMAELAYFMSPDYWGHGYMTEAVSEVTCFGLQKLKLHRIQAMVMPANMASIRVLEHAGFAKEGVLRKYKFGKEFHDAVMLAVIDEDNLK